MCFLKNVTAHRGKGKSCDCLLVFRVDVNNVKEAATFFFSETLT